MCIVEADKIRANAFALYVLPEIEILARVALAITRNRADAEDLVQDTLLNAFRAIDRFDGTFPRAWLLTIMRNAEAKRHRKRRPILLREGDAIEGLAFGPLDAASPEKVVVDDPFRDAVANILCSLNIAYRQVVELVDIQGLSYAEASEVLGIPVGTVMSRLHRARARIRKELGLAGIVPKRSLR